MISSFPDFKKHPFLADSLLIFGVSSAFILLEYLLSRGLMAIDSYSYLLFVHEVCESGWESALETYPRMRLFPPLLTMLLSGFGYLGWNYEIAGRAINILCVLLYGQGILFCCRKLYQSRQLAVCSAVIACSVPNVYFFGCQIMRDSMFWAELAWGLFFLLDLYLKNIELQQKLTDIVSLACICGLAVLTRKEGIVWSLIVLVLLFAREYGAKHSSMRFALFSGTLFMVILCLIVFLPAIFGIDFYPWYILDSVDAVHS